VLLIISGWLAATELLNPALGYFPTDSRDAARWSSSEQRVKFAAGLGAVRGDLWTQAAIAESVPCFFDAPAEQVTAASRQYFEASRITAEKAARSSPHDSRVWLVLACLNSRITPTDRAAVASLKLSYYTGSGELRLAPMRLMLALQNDAAVADEELRSLVELELRRIARQSPNMNSSITIAYERARAPGRSIVEAVLKQSNPQLLAALLKARGQAAPPAKKP
jgi:hypothetical protein